MVLYLIEILHQTTTGPTRWNFSFPLYLIEILHQTTTEVHCGIEEGALYLIEILHQTTTIPNCESSLNPLYLIEILHQTSTRQIGRCCLFCCILLKFYIKPQLDLSTIGLLLVVSY